MIKRAVSPPPRKPLIARLRIHANMHSSCGCVRCEAADEISRLRVELFEAYEQIDILLGVNSVTPTD